MNVEWGSLCYECEMKVWMFLLQDTTISKLTREIEVLKKDLRERDKLLSNANIKVSFVQCCLIHPLCMLMSV